MQPFFYLFGRQFSSYSVISMVGLGVAALFGFIINRKNTRVPREDIGFAALIAGVGAIIGAKILALMTEIPYIVEHAGEIFSSWDGFMSMMYGGWVFYGGLIGGIIGGWIYCRRWSVDFPAVADAIAPCVPLMHAFGRVGCLFSGCCYGIPWKYGITFTNAIGGAPNGVPLFPVQLVESGCNLLLCVALMLLRRKLKRPGALFAAYLGCYAVIRFTLEFLRGDTIRGVFILSTSQWISLIIAVGVAVWAFKKSPAVMPEAVDKGE